MRRVTAAFDWSVLIPSFSDLKKFCAISLASYFGLAALGYLVEESEDERKRRLGPIPTPEELFHMSPEQQEEVIKTKLLKLAPAEQEEYARQIREYQDQMEAGGASGAPAPLKGNKKARQKLPSSGQSEDNLSRILTRADKARQEGRLDEAEEGYKKAIALLEQDPEIGPNHYFTALTIYAYALVKRDKKDYQKSVQLMSKCLPIIKSQIEKSEKSLSDIAEFASYIQLLNQYADSLAAYADVLYNLDKYSEAEDSLNDSLNVIQKKFSYLGKIPTQTGEERKSIDQARKRILYEQAMLNDQMSRIKLKQKKFKEAEVLAKDSLVTLLEAIEERDHPGQQGLSEILTKSIKRLIEGCKEQGKDIEILFNDLLQQVETKYGKDTPFVLYILPSIAICYFVEHMYDKAEQTYHHGIGVLGKQPQANDDKNKITLFTLMNDLASAMYEQGKVTEAQNIRKTLKEKLKDTGFEPPHSISRYLKTISVTIKYERQSSNGSVAIFYEVVVETKENEKLPVGAVLEFAFENPENSSQPFTLEYTLEEGKQNINVKSPNVLRTTVGYNEIGITIYSDKTKAQKIGFHYLLCRVPIEASQSDTYDNVSTKMYQADAGAQSGGGGFFSF